MNTFLGVVIVLWVVITTIFTGMSLLNDYRYFPHIKQQCASQGYIQNTTVRINCSLEVPA